MNGKEKSLLNILSKKLRKFNPSSDFNHCLYEEKKKSGTRYFSFTFEMVHIKSIINAKTIINTILFDKAISKNQKGEK